MLSFGRCGWTHWRLATSENGAGREKTENVSLLKPMLTIRMWNSYFTVGPLGNIDTHHIRQAAEVSVFIP